MPVEPFSSRQVTLLRPGEDSEDRRSTPRTLPADLLGQAAARLRVIALLYAFVFFMAAFLPALLLTTERARFFSRFLYWGPGAISIATALVVAAVIRSARVPLPTVMSIGLAFEVVSSYGIAAAQFLGSATITSPVQWFGLSWVAVWTLLFTVVVPTPPRRAVAASLASVSSVPVVVELAIAAGNIQFRPSAAQFFFGLVFPYLLVVLMAYVGARVVYALGAEVSRARELGSYHLEERLGEGRMGEVWRARHRMLARDAAIKLIRPALAASTRVGAQEEAKRRFEREAQAIASLRSPHTVTLFDFGVAADGAFYYVMELLEGLDLETLVRKHGPVRPARAIYFLQQVCHSLSEAESIGLVHRDIKPANIFACRYGEDSDFVKVLDFGLVTTMHDPKDVPREGAVHGTPAYIAPEQARGSRDIDGRTDLYATGCVAYWLLTGQHVFTASTAMALLLEHMSAIPEPPSARAEQPIPPELDALILSCLEKDPGARPQSAAELSRRLSDIPVDPPWTNERARAWWNARRV